MEKIAVVIPTCREKQIKKFLQAWNRQFKRFNAEVIIVYDGDNPQIEILGDKTLSARSFMGECLDILSTHISAVRNAGIALAYKREAEFIVTLDDDLIPIGDTIGDHLKVLDQRVPISWIAVGNQYTRGFPYQIREEAEVVLSHGVWENVKDYDACTQLVRGNPNMIFWQMPIPKGIYFPMSGMNLAFKRKATPFMYWAPKEEGIARFDDIFMGIFAKREFDKRNWAVVTGYAKVKHNKMSNVFKNLQKEVRGIEANEKVWKNDFGGYEEYFCLYAKKRKRWKEFIKQL